MEESASIEKRNWLRNSTTFVVMRPARLPVIASASGWSFGAHDMKYISTDLPLEIHPLTYAPTTIRGDPPIPDAA